MPNTRDPSPDGLPGSEHSAHFGIEPAILREASVRCGVSERRLRTAVVAARVLSTTTFSVIEQLVELEQEGGRGAQLDALSEVLAFLPREDGSDPLAAIDEPMSTTEKLSSLVAAESGARKRRAEILQATVSAAEAAARTARSRQSIERLRRQGRALALRVGSQWRYPVWQLDADAPGGVVPGLGEVLDSLALSPVGAAAWLTRPHPRLDGKAPIERLRTGRRETVTRLAAEEGYML